VHLVLHVYSLWCLTRYLRSLDYPASSPGCVYQQSGMLCVMATVLHLFRLVRRSRMLYVNSACLFAPPHARCSEIHQTRHDICCDCTRLLCSTMFNAMTLGTAGRQTFNLWGGGSVVLPICDHSWMPAWTSNARWVNARLALTNIWYRTLCYRSM
jgi:hypothetical protein